MHDRVITACVREKSNISIVRLLQNVSIILGFVLVAFLVCFSGLKQISTLAMADVNKHHSFFL